MPHEKLRPAFTFDADRLAELRRIAPEAFADGRIHFETLREALGEHLEADGPDDEHFGLSWPGKRAARRLAATPSTGALVPAPGEGLKADGTPDTGGHNDSRNVFIEGENLEVLKLLQKSYAGRIKMIYIDPPYNTGNDFIYDDDFTETLQEYLARTGQLNEEGKAMTSNKRADGRFHSKWLTMMYPRLRLARNLLRDDGVIFVSIDDNEVHHLRNLMSEIFGEENFIASVIWQKVFSPKNTAKYFSEDHDYIVVYSKNSEIWLPMLLPRSEEAKARYQNPDSDSRGPWTSSDLTARNYYSAGLYEVTGPTGKIFGPGIGRYWRQSYESFRELDKENRIWWGSTGDNMPRLKRFLSEVKDGIVPQTLWLHTEVGNTQEAKKELIKYVQFSNTENVLNSVKPIRLIEKIIQIATDNSEPCIVLDFFSGSAPTAHAVLKKNLEDNGLRQFICVQIPEPLPTPEPSMRSIFDMGKMRVTNYLKEILNNPEHRLKNNDERFGFRVFRLTPSHYKAWQHYEGSDIRELENLFSQFESPLREGWTPEGLLTEVMLIEGFPLDSRQEALGGFSHNRVVRVTSDFCAHALLVCLDPRVHPDTIAALEPGPDDIFICLDSALTDEQKARLSDKGMLKTI